MVSETIIMEEDEASSTGHSALKSANKVHIWAQLFSTWYIEGRSFAINTGFYI